MKKNIVIISDGKTGHQNQSVALADAISRRHHCSIRIVEKRGFIPPAPDLLIGAGHGTHLRLIKSGQKFDCPTVVIMKPTLPVSLFSYVIAPKHDYQNLAAPKNVILTEGMLCRLPEVRVEKKNQGLILVGGPSKHYRWHTPSLIKQVESVLSDRTVEWKITDSRRTPKCTRVVLQSYFGQYFPSNQTKSEWLAEELLVSKFAWVTRDSMSMIYEALTSRAKVGLFDIPKKKEFTRVTKSVARILQKGLVTPFGEPLSSNDLETDVQSKFHEAGRCAELLLKQRLFD